MLRMVTDLLRERLTDHKSVAQYITKVRTAMTQLFSDPQGKGLVTEACVVLCTLSELQHQDRWREWTANIFMAAKRQDHGWLLQHAILGEGCRSI